MHRYLSLGHIAQSPIQPNPENYEWWGIHSFSGIPVPMSHHPHPKKNNLPHAHSNSITPQFKAIAPSLLSLAISHSQNQSKCHTEIQVDDICSSYHLNWCSLSIVEGQDRLSRYNLPLVKPWCLHVPVFHMPWHIFWYDLFHDLAGHRSKAD